MDPEELIVGTIYKIPSGLGGAFQIEYLGQARHSLYHVFLNQHEGWQHHPWNPVILTAEEVQKRVAPYKTKAIGDT